MTMKIANEKIFINNDNMARFVCLNCEKRIIIDVSDYKNVDKAVVIEHDCRCGHHSSVLLERRKFYRKDVSISGAFIFEKERVRRPMTVKDLSRAGLKFRSKLKHDINIGDRLTVEFRLDHMMIKKEVFVRTISDRNVGTEFCSRDPENITDKTYDKAIAHYILGSQEQDKKPGSDVHP